MANVANAPARTAGSLRRCWRAPRQAPSEFADDLRRWSARTNHTRHSGVRLCLPSSTFEHNERPSAGTPRGVRRNRVDLAAPRSQRGGMRLGEGDLRRCGNSRRISTSGAVRTGGAASRQSYVREDVSARVYALVAAGSERARAARGTPIRASSSVDPQRAALLRRVPYYPARPSLPPPVTCGRIPSASRAGPARRFPASSRAVLRAAATRDVRVTVEGFEPSRAAVAGVSTG